MKKKTRNKSTYSKKLQNANILMACMIVIFIVLFNLVNLWSVNEYESSGKGLQDLSRFYDDIELHTQHLKIYLSVGNQESLDEMQRFRIEIEDQINEIISLSSDKEKWQFTALKNMYSFYIKTSDHLMDDYQNNLEYEKSYNEFLETSDLLLNTSSEYYSIMTKMINEQLNQLEVIQTVSIVSSAALLCGLVLWLLYYSYQLTYSFSKPMNQLLRNINKIKEGKYDLSEVSGTSVEMEELCDALNEMSAAVQKKIETEELLAQSELKMLQNQINPHFLFNTLNMIYRMTLNEGADEAANMMIQLSHLLRYGLDNQKQTSSLKKEIEMIQKYIEIQEKRLGDRIRFVVEYGDLPELPMPGLILQPLIENSLIHGLHNVTEDGEVLVQIENKEKSIIINVSDNGEGMPSDEFEEMLLNDYQKKDGNHFGLYNVVKRLEMFFKDRVSIRVSSDEGCGFEFNIEIRKQDKDYYEISDTHSGR